MKRVMSILLVGAAVLLCTTAADAKRTKRTAIVVRGGWANNPPICDEAGVQAGIPPQITFSCVVTSPVNGGWTGFNVDRVSGTFYPNGDIVGTADGWFYGQYQADGSFGGIHFRGAWSIDGATGAFTEDATIVGGSCAFEGSSGRISFDGYQLFGGYVAEWIRPASPPAPDPTCNPIDPDSLPLREQTS